MSELRQGQVCWLDFGPVFVSAPAGRHPCVVVQNDTFNHSAISTTVCVCHYVQPAARRCSWEREAGLPKESVVNISQIATVDRSELLEYIGQMSPDTIAAILLGLPMLFDRVRQPPYRAD